MLRCTHVCKHNWMAISMGSEVTLSECCLCQVTAKGGFQVGGYEEEVCEGEVIEYKYMRLFI